MGDQEWNDALKQASQWASSEELRQLFVTVVMFCEVADTIAFWENNWRIMVEDIEYRLKQAFGSFGYSMPKNDLKNYVLLELEKLFNNNASFLSQHKIPTPTQGTLG